MMEFILKYIPPIHKEGFVFIFLFAVIAIILAMIHSSLGWIGLIATLWCAFFFRDPVRYIPQGESLVISPADGTIVDIKESLPPQELNMPKGKYRKISIFLNIFNVHVNRIPLSGIVMKSVYHAGKFLSATLDKASDDNERQSIYMVSNYKNLTDYEKAFEAYKNPTKEMKESMAKMKNYHEMYLTGSREIYQVW